jgi:prophage regulatory protein
MKRKPLKLISRDGLREKGVRFHPKHLDKLVKAGKFPRPVKIGQNKNAWIEDEVDSYIADRIAERDAQAAAISSGSAQIDLDDPTPTTGPVPAPATNEARRDAARRRRGDRARRGAGMTSAI